MQRKDTPSSMGSPAPASELEEEDFKTNQDWRRGSIPVGDLLHGIVDPIYARRGFSSSALIQAWSDIVGPAFADCTIPEKISWDRSSGHQTGTLIIRVDGPRSVYLQHERNQILERLNRFLGFHAVHSMKLVQAPLSRTKKTSAVKPAHLTKHQEQRLREHIGDFDDNDLQEAIVTMGREVLRRALSQK